MGDEMKLVHLGRSVLLPIVALALLGTTAPVPKQGQGLPFQIPFQAEFKTICGARWLDRAVQVKAESNYDPNAVSFDHGEGLGQATNIWPMYIRNGWVPPDSTPFQVVPAIQGAHKYMLYQERVLGGWIPGCGGYNAGAGNIKKAQFLAKQLGLVSKDGWLEALPQITKSNARYTQRYIKHIRQYRQEYFVKFGE